MAKITVIDDDRMICQMLGALLGNEGHETCCLTDSSSAISNLIADIPHLIILDVMMPELDGIGLLRKIRQTECLHGTKVVMYSASDDVAVSAESLRLGAAEFLQKGAPWENTYRELLGISRLPSGISVHSQWPPERGQPREFSREILAPIARPSGATLVFSQPVGFFRPLRE